MGVHLLRAVQVLPASIDEVWDFFSDPRNLAAITPKSMGFEVLSEPFSDRMYPGQIIEYYVRPLAGIRLYWMTEITHVVDKVMFVDEQRRGPYRLWHHQHHFKVVEGGVEMTDLVHYESPVGWIGEMMNGLVVRKKLMEIFEFRFRVTAERFGGGGEVDVRIIK